MLERARSTGLLTPVRRLWQQQGKGARVGGGARAAVARAGDAMLGGAVLILSSDVGSSGQGGGEPKDILVLSVVFLPLKSLWEKS
jgi:hypothetical protein